MAKSLEGLTHAEKDTIIRKAIEVCKWIGWIKEESGNPERSLSVNQVLELKQVTEKALGGEIEVYT